MLVPGLREPAYCGITEDAPQETPKRRPTARSLKERFTNIVSMYVPNVSSQNSSLLSSKSSRLHQDLVEDGDVAHSSDQFGLLSLINVENQEESIRPVLCQITPQIDRSSLYSSVCDCLSDSGYSITLSDFLITCLSMDASGLYFGIKDLPIVFKLPIGSQVPMTKIHLKTSESLDLVPSKICLKGNYGETSEIYVIGTAVFEGAPMHLISCFTPEGKLLAQTRKYAYRRFLAIDVDEDGNLLLGCAANPDEESGSKGGEAQICKLTPHFERRIFSITMRKGDASYSPDSITRSCVHGQCWASVNRWDNASKMSMRRIFAFPGSQPDLGDGSGPKRSPKEWLQVISWSFESFAAGAVYSLDSQRVLALDVERKSLAIITWPEGQNSVSLQRITKPGSRKIDHLCVCTSAYPPVAYFVSEGDVFRFVPAPLDAGM